MKPITLPGRHLNSSAVLCVFIINHRRLLRYPTINFGDKIEPVSLDPYYCFTLTFLVPTMSQDSYERGVLRLSPLPVPAIVHDYSRNRNDAYYTLICSAYPTGCSTCTISPTANPLPSPLITTCQINSVAIAFRNSPPMVITLYYRHVRHK